MFSCLWCVTALQIIYVRLIPGKQHGGNAKTHSMTFLLIQNYVYFSKNSVTPVKTISHWAILNVHVHLTHTSMSLCSQPAMNNECTRLWWPWLLSHFAVILISCRPCILVAPLGRKPNTVYKCLFNKVLKAGSWTEKVSRKQTGLVSFKASPYCLWNVLPCRQKDTKFT